MSFSHPEYFLLLLLLIPLVVWHLLLRRHHRPALRVATTEFYRQLPLTPRTALVHAPLVVRIMLLSFLSQLWHVRKHRIRSLKAKQRE